MRAAVVVNGVYTNVIEAEDLIAAEALFPDAVVADAESIPGAVGWRLVGSTWLPPEPDSEPVPETVTDWQFFQALASNPWNLISKEEALAAVKTGEIPGAMQAYVDELPEDHRFGAAMLISGATSFARAHWLVSSFSAAQGMSAAQTDQLWRFAGSLR